MNNPTPWINKTPWPNPKIPLTYLQQCKLNCNYSATKCNNTETKLQPSLRHLAMSLESNPTDHPHSAARNPNPWKHGSSKCNSIVPWPQSPKTIVSSSQPRSSRTKLLFGGVRTTSQWTG